MSKHISAHELNNWFAYHQPSAEAVRNAHEMVRAAYGSLAQRMNNLLPEGPDKTVALRAIRTAMYHANAAIACQQAVYGQEQPAGGPGDEPRV